MIAARGRDDPGHSCPRALQIFHVDDAAAYLEGASRRMVLVLHPHFASGPFGEKRPSILWRWWDRTMHEVSCSFQFCKAEHHIGASGWLWLGPITLFISLA